MIQDQPPPVAQPERVPVWSLVIADYRTLQASEPSGDTIDRLVLADMESRDQLGRARYGTPLTTHNGRDHLIDAYQEALDFAVYLRAWLEEHPDNRTIGVANLMRRRVDTMYRDHLARLWSLRHIIENRP